jgi:succinyl-diaminopimelate desuccinylase
MVGPMSRADIQAETRRLLTALVACRSLTPSDGGSLEFLGARLAAGEFRCEWIEGGGVTNLWARRGTSAPLVCLAGHVDVVPPGPLEQWTSDPFVATERDGYLYGRGVADMKGAVAAMVTAAERIVRTEPDRRGSIGILLTSDEEGDAVHGTAAVVEWLRARGEAIDACILGEPTSTEQLGDTLKNGRRGSVNGTLRVRGVQCHIAYPERGRNPIGDALPALTELRSVEWDRGTDHFPPTSFQFSNVQAGTGATNVIPGTLDVGFNFRFSPASPVDRLEARVREVLDRHGLEYELSWAPAALPFVTPRGPLVDAVSEAVTAVTGLVPKLSTSGGTSDGRFLSGVSREIIEMGPVNESIHKVDERIRLDDLGVLSAIYERAVLSLLRR